MTKKDEQKTAFHTKEGVFCYTKMPFGLKNKGATYQRLVNSVFKEQIGVKLEAYVEDMVIKSRTEQDIIKDIKQTFSTLQRINMKLNPKKCSFDMEEGKFLAYIVTSKGIRTNPKITKAVMDMSSLRTLKKMQSLSGKLAAFNRFCLISVVLLIERNERQMPIHYVSRSLQRAETNYALMEKLTLALVHAARRLWRVAVKGQVLADFLTNISMEINDAPVVVSTPRVEDVPESSNAMEILTPSPRAWRLYIDRASNNEGSRACLILIAPADVEYSYGNGAVERENVSLLRGIQAGLNKEGLAWAEEVQNELRLNSDLLEERREIAAIREARKNEASRTANIGKLGPIWDGPYKVIQAFQSGAYKLSNMEREEIPRT
nr:hypothetical protein [Tanacetum cinerariifolium]